MDAGFALIDEYCKKKKIGILGYYHANANFASNDWTTLSRRIADKVRPFLKACTLHTCTDECVHVRICSNMNTREHTRTHHACSLACLVSENVCERCACAYVSMNMCMCAFISFGDALLI
jgi:hypothetical protein